MNTTLNAGHEPIPADDEQANMTRMYFVRQDTTGLPFFVYTTLNPASLHHGHEAGLWYFKPQGHYGFAPVSGGYGTRREAIDALNVRVAAIATS